MIIETPKPEDAPLIEQVAEGTGVFNSSEICVVREMLDTFFHPEPRDDHQIVVYRNGNPNGVAGFACYGPTPLTDRVWDLYWICVERAQQGQGIGSHLLQQVEGMVREQNARAIYLETSDSETYTETRRFYEQHGYEKLARIDNFYAPGEGKVIYRKVFQKD